MAVVPEIFMSKFLDKTVIDNGGKKVGRVSDILIDPESDLPRVVGFLVVTRNEKIWVPVDVVQVWVRQYLMLKVPKNKLTDFVENDQLLSLRRDLLDKQVIDLNGRKVVRINDLKFADVQGELRLVAVDIGFRGLLRRLGLSKFVHWWERRFGKEILNVLILWQDVARIEKEHTRIRLVTSVQKLAKLHPADLADIIEELNNQDRTSVMQTLALEVAAETLQEIEPDVQTEILEHLAGERASDILEAMPADEAADILGELTRERAEQLLNLMEQQEAAEVRKLLKYEEKTSGRLMSTDFLSFPENLTVEETIVQLRSLQPDADSIYYLYVVDTYGILKGVVSLRDLVVARADTLLASILGAEAIFVRDYEKQEKVAELMTKYDLLAIPVVDREHKLLGMININDVVDAVFLPYGKRKYSRGF